MNGSLEGKVALVTGGASGIGRAAALAMAREGAKLGIADINEEGGEQTVQLVTESGGDAIFVKTNVTQASEVENFILNTVETYGRLDCALNNAGIIGASLMGGEQPGITEYPEDVWNQVIDINLTSVFLCMKYEISQMCRLKQGCGSIVNIASIGGLLGMSTLSAYVGSKHGVVGLTKTAALEYGRMNIRINCVCPGYIQTGMTAAASLIPERNKKMIESIPLGRLGKPEEVAEAVVWLCSEASSFVTGHALAVDGGYTAQ